MKSFVFVALLAQIHTSRVKLHSKFIPGDIEDDDLINPEKQAQFNKENKATLAVVPP
jgi:hypothetical protein